MCIVYIYLRLLRSVEREDKVNAGKSKVMILNGEEGLEWKVHVDGIRLEQWFPTDFGPCPT